MAERDDNEGRGNALQGVAVTPVTGGMVQDTEIVNQPQGTYRYALNMVRESHLPKHVAICNEQSNDEFLAVEQTESHMMRNEYIIGCIDVGDEKFVLFTVSYYEPAQTPYMSHDPVSRIYIYDSRTGYISAGDMIVDDTNSAPYDKLRFNEHHQIEGLYRLRNGCERHVYWTDNINVPRTMNIDRPEKYVNAAKNPVASKFNLIKTYSRIPYFERIDRNGDARFGVEVLDGGKLMPGGYNVTVRLIDADKNATEWITVTNTIIVSNESPANTEYQKMRGSTSKQSEWQKFGDSGKMIRVSVKGDSIDTNYEYVQFGLIERNSGTGEDMQVVLSQPVMISADVPNYYTYTFTGDAGYGTDTVESVDVNTMVVGKAKTITDNNSRLLLGNIEGKNVDWCLLQKYASKIESKCVVKHITLDNLDDKDCVASAIYNNEDVGYMPGEVYSFGIVYVFDDGSVSPVYHIPGPNSEEAQIVDPNLSTEYPMHSYECQDATYINDSTCEDTDYWGVDNIGQPLAGEKVRHHKFPLRNEIFGGIPLVSRSDYNTIVKSETNTYVLYLYARGSYVDKVYKRNFEDFTINVRLAFNKNGNNYEYFQDVPVTIKCDDWDRAAGSNKRCVDFNGNEKVYTASGILPQGAPQTYELKGFYAVKLGVFNDTPVIYAIGEQPRQYIRSEGDWGTRFGWCTSGAHIKCKYTIPTFGEKEWIEDDSNSNDYPNEDGSDIIDFFYKRTIVNKKMRLPNCTPGYNWGNKAKAFIHCNINDYPAGYYNVSCVNRLDFGYGDYADTVNNFIEPNYYHQLIKTKDFNIKSDKVEYDIPILGIRFDNIEIPSLEDTNGNHIIGYYIVRNKRDDENKTVLDSAITLPVSTDKKNAGDNAKFLSYGNSFGGTIKDSNNLAFINLEHLFLKKKYKKFSFVVDGKLVQDRHYNFTDENGTVVDYIKGKIFNYEHLPLRPNRNSSDESEDYSSADTDFIFEDIQPGTSYDKSANSKKDADKDGFDLFTILREFVVKYECAKRSNNYDADDVAYLSPLESMTTSDGKQLYNISSDNSVGIMSKNNWNPNEHSIYGGEYGYMYRNTPNAYGNFRAMPYYKDSKNIIPAHNGDTGLNSGAIFSGDVYVSPMRYVNSVFYDNKLKKRRRKKAIWRIIGGAIGAVASVVAGVYGGPALGIAGLTASISLITSGINIAKANQVYNKLYNAGLKATVEDSDLKDYFTIATHFDDQIQWSVEAINSIWFESTINLFWRNTLTADYPKPLDPLTHWNTDDYVRYMRDKFLVQDSESANGLLYIGYAKSEFYDYNYDYLSKTNHKVYHALPDTYDCCLKCNEKFTHRIIYSEKSFIEERTDNYRKFLPMNYKDVEGIKGDITALLSHNNDVIVLCREGSWGLILNTQPMVIGGIVSYLGTGDMFTISPKPYVMACQHQFSIQKMNGIIMFVDVFNKCVWMYSSKQNSYGTYVASPEDIAHLGMRRFLFDELGIDEREYNDNPASIIGHGYVIGYDPELQRIVVTKKDTRPENWRTDDIIETNGQLYDMDQIDDRIQDFADNHNNDMYDADTNPEGWRLVETDKDNALLWFKRTYKTTDSKWISGGRWTPYVNGQNVIDSVWYKIGYYCECINPETNNVELCEISDRNDLVALGFDLNNTAPLKLFIGNMSYDDNAPLDPRFYDPSFNIGADSHGYLEFPDSNQYEQSNWMDYSALYFNPKIMRIEMTRKEEHVGDLGCSYKIMYEFKIVVDKYIASESGSVGIDIEYYECGALDSWVRIADPTTLNVKCKLSYNNNGATEIINFPIKETDQFGIVRNYSWSTDVNVYDKFNMQFYVKNVNPEFENIEVLFRQQMPIEYVNGRYKIRFYVSEGCSDVPASQYNAVVRLICQKSDDMPDAATIMNEFDSSMYVVIADNPVPTQYPLTLSQTTPYVDNGDGTVTFFFDQITTNGYMIGQDWSHLQYHIFTNQSAWLSGVMSYGASPDIAHAEVVIIAQYPVSIPAQIMDTIDTELVCTPSTNSGVTVDEVAIEVYKTEYDTIPLVPISEIGFVNYGWTLSFHIPDMQWVSFHSYIPNMYFNNSEHMFTIADRSIWRHGVEGDFCRFNGINRDCTIEYVSVENNGLVVKVWDDISLMADVVKLGQNGPYKITDKFFDKLLVWNTRQMSGDIDLTAKDSRNGAGYLVTQLTDVFADCNEGVWSINGFRDNVVDYQKPMFIIDKDALQQDWFVDKKVNPDAIVDAVTGNTKQWFNSERMRDRFMCVRLTKTADNDLNKQDIKYIVYLTEDEVTRSER